MPRWTKEHWARLDVEERSMLMELLKGLKQSGFYGGQNVPEDVYLCRCCGEFGAYCTCYELLEEFTQKMGVSCPDI